MREVNYPHTGDIVSLHSKKSSEVYEGIVKSFDSKGGIFLDVYDFGFPIELHFDNVLSISFQVIQKDLEYDLHKHTIDAYVGNLKDKKISMESHLESEDLVAATWASRQHHLEGVINALTHGGRDAHQISPRAPHTGVYVVCAANDGPYRCSLKPEKTPLEGVVSDPRLPPARLAGALQYFYPQGFGDIEVDEGDQDCACDETLMNHIYFAYEVPQRACEFVTSNKPRKLAITR